MRQFSLFQFRERHLSIYFKHAKQEVAHVGSIIHSHQFPLINNDFVYIDENTYICFCQAESILSLEEKPHNLQSVKIDDNPILGLYKLIISTN